MSEKAILIIMDGWGHGQHPPADAIYQSQTPFVKSLYQKYPHCELITSGKAVGLPDGQMGNSEVGHLNFGAGRIVFQELMRFNNAIENGELAKNQSLLNIFKYVNENNKNLHYIGLVSNGGVHSSDFHLKALCDYAKNNSVKNLYIHAFTDGRDTDPKSGIGFLAELESHLKKNNLGKIASVVGRYYAMDRDNRWERIKLAYDLLVKGSGKKSNDVKKAVSESYAENVTDEFIKPICICDEKNNPLPRIQNGDAVLCFNFRTDRCREITKALTQQDFPQYEMKKLDLNYTTMTIYDHTFKNVQYHF